MDAKARRLAKLVDAALVEAERVHQGMIKARAKRAEKELVGRAIFILGVIKQRAIDGSLLRPSEGSTFGLSRYLDEWCEDRDLAKAVDRVDAYYEKRM